MKCKLNYVSKFLSFSIIIFLLTSCNDYPKDMKDSWKEAQKNGLKVGVVDNPPFTVVKENSFSGEEVSMIREFASQNNMNVKFEGGNETHLIEKLEKYELDIVVGGFVKKTVWKKKVAPTTPYDNEKHVFLIPKGENKLLGHLEDFIYNNKKK